MGDGRAFWRLLVSEATGCADNDYFEEVFELSWRLFLILIRLHKLPKDLDVARMFDAIIISSEVGYEKPAAEIFRAALDQLGVEAGKVIYVGKVDKNGSNAIGIDCWLWGPDVKTFTDIYDRILISSSQ